MSTNMRRGPLVDAEPARRHVRELMAAGVSYARIARAANVTTSTVNHMLYPRSGRPITERLNHENARRILAVDVAQVPTGLVDPTGARRRLQALMAIGWPALSLGGSLGLHPGYVREIQRRPTIYATTAHAMAVTYNKLWDKQPEHYGISRQAANRTRNYAKANGWAPPAAWDDDALDDPNRGPDTQDVALGRNELAAYRRDEVEFLCSYGIPDEDIALRLDMALSTVRALLLEIRTGQRRNRTKAAA